MPAPSQDSMDITVKEEAKKDGLCTQEKNTKDKEQETKDNSKCSDGEQETKDDGELSDGEVEELEDGEINEEKEDVANSKLNNTNQTCRFYSKGQCFFGSNCRFQHLNSASGNYSMFAPSTPAPPANDYYTSYGGMMNHRIEPPPPRSYGPDFFPPALFCPRPPVIEVAADVWGKGLETARELVRKANKRKIEEGPNYPEKSLNLSLNANEKNVNEFLENEPISTKRKKDIPFPKYDEPLDAHEHFETKNSYKQGFHNNDARYHRKDHRGGYRSRLDRDPHDKREYRPKSPLPSKERYDRLQEVDPPRRDANAYFDPWRRSKSPNENSRRSRSRSYSSVSSNSWSDESFSSRGSSRSRSRSVSRSRSFSRSISMSNVSSASSRDSLSHSSGSISRCQNSTSILRKRKTVDPPHSPPTSVPLPNMYLNHPLPGKEGLESPVTEELDRDPLEEKFLASGVKPKKFPSLQHLLPTSENADDPLKVAHHKPLIKLTLLNKKPQHKMNIIPKKELHNSPSPPPLPPVVDKIKPVLIPKRSAVSRRDELLKQLKDVEDAIARKRAKFG